MYSWIWRHLPGSRAVKLLEALLLVAAVLTLLMLVVFPWVEPRLPFNEVTAGYVAPLTRSPLVSGSRVRRLLCTHGHARRLRCLPCRSS
jgi:hypothetical protein